MIYYNYKHQPVGEMQNTIFVKRVKPQHFMRIYQGYGISSDIFNQIDHEGCTEIRINTGEDLYKISMEDFKEHSIEANFDDPQIFCPLKFFTSKAEVDRQKQLDLG